MYTLKLQIYWVRKDAWLLYVPAGAYVRTPLGVCVFFSGVYVFFSGPDAWLAGLVRL